MNPHVVEFVEMERVPVRVTRNDAFSVDPHGRLVWAQRLCCWALAKLGAFHVEDTVEIRRHVFDKRSFMARLFKNQVVVRQFNCEPKQLLLGPEDFQELMGGEEIRSLLSFQTTYYNGPRILGLEVKVIPWMRGVLVVP